MLADWTTKRYIDSTVVSLDDEYFNGDAFEEAREHMHCSETESTG
jgi:hypothetical protein